MLPDKEFVSFCEKQCLGEHINLTGCTESDFVDCLMFPKRILEVEYLVPITLLLVIIFFTGLVGNLSVCTVIARHPSLRSETNAYLFSLAVSDLLLLIFGLPSELWYYWQMYPYIFGDFLCRTNNFMTATGTWASVLTVVAFSIERYEAICHPLRYRSRGAKRVTMVICAIWTLSIASALPILHVYHEFMKVVDYPSEAAKNGSPLSRACTIPANPEYSYYNYLYIINTVVFFFIPMVILLLAYTRIALFLRANRQLSRNCGIQNSCSENRRTFKMLAAVVLAFFICGAPYHYQRVTTPRSNDDREPEEMSHDRTVMVVTALFYYFSATINPILYNAMSKRYRKAFMDIFWTQDGSSENRATTTKDVRFIGSKNLTTQTLITN